MGSLLRTFLGILSLTALVTDISQNSVPYNTHYGHFSEFCPLQHSLRTFLRILSLTAPVTDISQNSVPYSTRYGHFSEFCPLQHSLRTFLRILSLTAPVTDISRNSVPYNIQTSSSYTTKNATSSCQWRFPLSILFHFHNISKQSDSPQ